MLQAPPDRLLLTFNEQVSPFVLSLIAPDGGSNPLSDFRIEGRTLIVGHLPVLGPGTWALSWRVASADGHPVGGALFFSVGAPSPAPPEVPELYDRTVRILLWAATVALYCGLFLGAGGAFAVSWFGDDRSGSRFASTAILLGLAVIPAAILLQGFDALGAPLGRVALIKAWEAGAATTFSWKALIALIALGLGLLALAAPRPWNKALSLPALLGVGAALAASGHASAAEPQWLSRPLVFLHGAGIALWIGALAPLGMALWRDDAKSSAFLWRFSKTAPFAVAAVAIPGIALAFIQIGRPAALVETDYGRLFLAKLALLVVLFGLAAANRWRLTAPAGKGESAARQALRHSVGAELVIALAIFCVAAGWRFTPPPRALAEIEARPVSMHIHTLPAMADLTIAPGHSGPVSAAIVLMTGDFGPLDPKAVTLVLSKPGTAPIEREAQKPGDGTWRVEDLVIPAPGKWNVEIRISAAKAIRLEGEIVIRP